MNRSFIQKRTSDAFALDEFKASLNAGIRKPTSGGTMMIVIDMLMIMICFLMMK